MYPPERPAITAGSLVLLSPLGLWRDDAPIPLMEMVSGPGAWPAENHDDVTLPCT